VRRVERRIERGEVRDPRAAIDSLVALRYGSDTTP
jgi:hypothetical protein